jgi:hypothetical protein
MLTEPCPDDHARPKHDVVNVAAPFVVGLALACGFALERLMPRADDFFSPEEAAELRKRVWERHWAENAARGDEHAARMAFDMDLGHTHTDH